jgi:murein L,D-transpeptidase YcbB/YkuD
MRSRRRFEITILLLMASMPFTGHASAQARKTPAATSTKTSSTQKPQGAPARLSAIVASGRLDDLRWPNFSDYRVHLTNFYRPSGYKSAWIRDDQPTPQALELIHIFQDADREGLQAEDYDASRWDDRLASLKGPHQEAEQARFDAALTVCVMRYVSDLHVGRINPKHVGFEFDVSHKKLNLPQFVRSLVDGSDLRSELVEVEPPFAGYQRLREALQHYMELAKTDNGEKLPDPIRIIPGEKYAGMERLASLLRLLGDLPEDVTIPPDSNFEGPIVDAVKHFQGRVAIKPTGILDRKTVAAMNVPLSDRLEEMRLGLERYRWLPYTFKQPPIAVNVPEFRLYGFDEEHRVGITMNVNVGEEFDFQTPIFEDNIQYIVFRPYWNPPPKILRNEIIPDLQQEPDLEENNLELVSPGGKVIRTGNVTPSMMQQIRSGALIVREPPGPENALGLVKFIFPNEHHVYIHDTPEGVDMFSEKIKRSVSHGCIHAQEPAKLADWVLRNTPGWDYERVEKAMHEGRDNFRVNLAAPIPVLIVYVTAVVEENGDVHFFDDVYGHDATLKEELAKGYPYPK